MEILIFDSGVNEKHPTIKNNTIEGYSLIYNEENNKLEKNSLFYDENGHGTAVYHIISKQVKNITIKMIKLFNKALNISEEHLCAALEYIYVNENPDIINMSLGINICRKYERLYSICKKLSERNIILISAFDNMGSISFPAAFDNVIGVDSVTYLKKRDEFEYIENSIINIRAKGGIMRLAWLKPDYIISGGNSFACAIISGLIANYMDEHRRICNNMEEFEAHTILKQKAVRTYVELAESEKEQSMKLFNIEKSVLFPFNKEMHSLVRFINMLSFEIEDIYDIKYSGRVGAFTSQILQDDSVKKIKIKDIKEIEWSAFDTLIIGHLDELSSITDNNLLRENLINKAISYGKKIFSFDPIYYIQNNKNIFLIKNQKKISYKIHLVNYIILQSR